MPKVYVDTKNLSREELEQLLIDKEEENKKLKGLLKEHITTYDVHFDELIEENKKLKEERDFCRKQLEDYQDLEIMNAKLGEENRILREGNNYHIEEKNYCYDEWEKEVKKLNEYNRRLKQANEDLRKQNSYRKKIVDIIPQDEKSVAEETIQDLQERIRFLEQCLDNKEKVNKSLREELGWYKRQYEHTMGED